MAGLLVAGCTSDAGKSVVTTGLCRAMARRGISVAPYKAQNMSNNSMVCTNPDGTMAEIGRAQWVQALAARVPPEPAMNPVLLKPGSDRRSHVVLMGQPAGSVGSGDWLDGRRHLAHAAHQAFDDLASRFELVIAEGAGSPAEINLRAGDYVNMGLARHANLPTVIVGDIDRGGVFAAMFGTTALLEPSDQQLVAGYLINRFRGDGSLLTPGLAQLEKLTGRPVFGVLPWHSGLWLDSEDALDVAGRRANTARAARVVAIRLPRISNFTDLDALALEPDIDLVFGSTPADLSDADLIVVPGTRATLADLQWLRERGLDQAIATHAHAGKPVLGICGGCQMLGREIRDPDGIEGPAQATVPGLGLLDIRTRFVAEKVLRLPQGEAFGCPVGGYEIHHGQIAATSGEAFLDGVRAGRVFGTMWHGSLEADAFRRAFLAETLGIDHVRATSVSFAQAREQRIDTIADLMEEFVEVDALVRLATHPPAASYPELPPAGGMA